MKSLYSSIIFLLVLSATTVCAQQFPLFSQYIYDPYLINPSLVASARKSEANLLYRQQWTGITNSPQTLQFDFQLPVNERISLGINVYDDKTVLLSNTSVMMTFGYKVPLAADHILGFGISAGILSNRLRLEDVSDVDLNDPALLAATNNFNFDGQFGVHYNYKNFILGFSLTKLTDNEAFSENEFQEIKFNQLKNKIAFTSYRFILSDNFAFQPAFAYHFTSDDLNFFDALGIISYKNTVDLGGGYREHGGPSALIRLSWKNLQIGYVYEFPSNKINVATGGTNEIQLKWRFGKVVNQLTKKNQPVNQPLSAPTQTIAQEDNEPVKETDAAEDTMPSNLTEQSAYSVSEAVTEKPETPSEKQQTEYEPTNAVVNQEQESIKQPPHEHPVSDTSIVENNIESNTWYYLIVGTFEKRSNADRLVNSLRNDNITAEVKHIRSTGYYYVHLPQFKTQNITLEKVLDVRRLTQFIDAWFKQLED